MKIIINSQVLHRAIAPMMAIVGNSLLPISNKGVVMLPHTHDPYQKWRYLVMPTVND